MSSKLVVHESFRTNELSHTPGGYEVTVIYSNGSSRVYDKVKNPEAYSRSIIKDQSIKKILVEGQIFWSRN